MSDEVVVAVEAEVEGDALRHDREMNKLVHNVARTVRRYFNRRGEYLVTFALNTEEPEKTSVTLVGFEEPQEEEVVLEVSVDLDKVDADNSNE